MYCSCSRKCVAGSCPCVDNALHCTDAYKKQNCENFPDENEGEDSCVDYSSDDDEDEDDDYENLID